MQAHNAFDSQRRANRRAGADLRNRLNSRWLKGRKALPPKHEIILTPLNATCKGRNKRPLGTTAIHAIALNTEVSFTDAETVCRALPLRHLAPRRHPWWSRQSQRLNRTAASKGRMTNRVTDRGIWIESDAPLASTAQWSIPLRLVKAVADGETANLGGVSPLLAGNLETIRDIYAAWIPGHKIPLAFELLSNASPAASGVSLFFSGGVDSFYSLIKHRDEVENLILVHGFDVSLADAATFALAEIQAREAARIYGKRLILAKTNMHFEQQSVPCGWGMYHGAGLAAVAYALAPNHGKVYIASTYSYADLHPWGSHPILDPLWSTETLEIVHDGGETRVDKLRVLAQYPDFLRQLRVCWENLGTYNCGRCEKCIRTMLGLLAVGVNRCAAFPDTLTPQLVSQQELNHDTVLYWQELLDQGLPRVYEAAVRSSIRSFRFGLPPRTGKPKREIKRWLYAARHAGKKLLLRVDRS